MNRLQFELCRILDFPEEYADLAMREADHREKLRSVFMFVNGTLCRISGYNSEDGTILADKVWTKVETLDVWLPETGIYTSSKDGSKILLQKRPIKQWKKSFSLECYIMARLSYNCLTEELDFRDYVNSKVETIYADTEKVYAFRDNIGNILPDNTVKCLRPEFYQEILDYSTREGLQWNVLP